MAGQLLNSGAVDLLLVDSAAALAPRLELDSAVGDGGAGLQSRVLSSGLRRLGVALRRNPASAVFLNQSRKHPDAPIGEREASAGGPALKLHAAVRIEFQPESGRRVRLRSLRSVAGKPFQAALWSLPSPPNA
jgi:recombination protein RecA